MYRSAPYTATGSRQSSDRLPVMVLCTYFSLSNWASSSHGALWQGFRHPFSTRKVLSDADSKRPSTLCTKGGRREQRGQSSCGGSRRAKICYMLLAGGSCRNPTKVVDKLIRREFRRKKAYSKAMEQLKQAKETGSTRHHRRKNAFDYVGHVGATTRPYANPEM